MRKSKYWKPHSLLVGKEHGAAALENGGADSEMAKTVTTGLGGSMPRHLRETKTHLHTKAWPWVFTTAKSANKLNVQQLMVGEENVVCPYKSATQQ